MTTATIPYVSTRQLKNGHPPLREEFDYSSSYTGMRVRPMQGVFSLVRQGRVIDTVTSPQEQAEMLSRHDAIDWEAFLVPVPWDEYPDAQVVEISDGLAFDQTTLTNHPAQAIAWRQKVDEGKDPIYKPLGRHTVQLRVMKARDLGKELVSSRNGFSLV